MTAGAQREAISGGAGDRDARLGPSAERGRAPAPGAGAPRLRDRAASLALACRRHPRHVVLGALVAGLLVAGASPRVAPPVAGLAACAGAAIRRPGLGLLAAAAVLGGTVGGHARLAALDRSALGPRLGDAVTVRAILLEPPRRRPFGGWTVPARIDEGPGVGERIVVHGRGPVTAAPGSRGGAGLGSAAAPTGLEPGVELSLRGRLERLADGEGYEARRRSHAALEADEAVLTGRRRGGLAGAVDRIRDAAQRGVTAGLPAAQAALARGMVLGDDSALDDDTREAFQASGLAHVLAASGQNVALLALLATALLRAAGTGLRVRLGGALGLVALYVPLAGGGPSIQRAGIMAGAALVAGLAGRPASRAYALLLAAATTLAISPRAAGEPGWQLSFAAVLAIAAVAPRLRGALVVRRVPGPLAEALAVTVAATAGTAPLVALHFQRLSLVALPANLAAAPAVAPVVWLGTAAGALAQLGGIADPAVRSLDAVATLPLGFVGAVAAVAARAPAATVPLALGVPAALAAYAALGAIVVSRRARVVALGAGLAATAALLLVHARRPAAPRDLTVSFLDVGQGDATLLQDGSAAVLVDTGPPGGPIVARLRAAGVRRLDLLVLTHAQADHEGAAPAILHAFPVRAVLDGGATSPSGSGASGGSSVPAADSTGAAAAGSTAVPAAAPPAAGPSAAAPWAPVPGGDRATVAAAVAGSGAQRLLPAAGELLRVGRLRLRVLWPPDTPPPPGTDPNDRAIVLLVRDGTFSALLTADAESPVTGPLDLPRVDALKVAHHGSDDPGLPALLARLHPRAAAIEVGRDNPYGHPTASTLHALRRAVPIVRRTDRDGTIRLTVAHGRMRVTTDR